MTKMNNVIFNIRQRRENLGFSQEYIASELDINQSTYAKIESGKIDLSVNRLMEIAKILQCHINDLLGKSGNSYVFNNNKMANAHQFVQNLNTSDAAYEALVISLREEVAFLRSLIQNNTKD